MLEHKVIYLQVLKSLFKQKLLVNDINIKGDDLFAAVNQLSHCFGTNIAGATDDKFCHCVSPNPLIRIYYLWNDHKRSGLVCQSNFTAILRFTRLMRTY
jgi:hypothetical protein